VSGLAFPFRRWRPRAPPSYRIIRLGQTGLDHADRGMDAGGKAPLARSAVDASERFRQLDGDVFRAGHEIEAPRMKTVKRSANNNAFNSQLRDYGLNVTDREANMVVTELIQALRVWVFLRCRPVKLHQLDLKARC